MPKQDSLGVATRLTVDGTAYTVMSLERSEASGAGPVSRLPRTLKILYENLLRNEDGRTVTGDDLSRVAKWIEPDGPAPDVAFHPDRIVLNDSGGLPTLADIAALRAAVVRQGGRAEMINPCIPADLVVDHSVMVDLAARTDALARNLELEYARNGERYAFLKWCEGALDRLRVVPPGSGILHQVNLEHFARVAWCTQRDDDILVSAETLLGTDSHTPMINGLAVFGWGVGGIEAVAALLGLPVSLSVPPVVGCRLDGRLRAGVTATDLALLVTERLRQAGVVGSFVEFFGPGLADLPQADRATIANMAPEYGATMGFFPVDEETLTYLEATGRGGHHARLVEAHAKQQGLWHDPGEPLPAYGDVVEIDLTAVEPAMAGPRRPQDRVTLPGVPASFAATIEQAPSRAKTNAGGEHEVQDGDVVIAAITSCTNTSNPSVMLGAGLLARKARARGLRPKPWVKTSLAPGSRVVADYLAATGLQADLDALGFHLVGFGCTTCMGNSGPLLPGVAEAIEQDGVTTVAVLSGNRNFEGRIHPLVRANYIGSPPLVVAYALAGSARHDLTREPLGTDLTGRPVFLAEIWPTADELSVAMAEALGGDRHARCYAALGRADESWASLEHIDGDLFPFSDTSLYLKEPPFLQDVASAPEPVEDIVGARALVLLGDSITTDHISPVGIITPRSAAGHYLQAQGVQPADFNSFAARRINHEVMIRGAFANVRLRNELVPEREGGFTRHMPSNEVLPIHEAAGRYSAEGVPLVVVAGKEYGTGSSRDWAAKGTRLLGVRAVIAEGFERIHRSNLVYMGVLPLQLPEGVTRRTLGLDGSERFDIVGVSGGLSPRQRVDCRIQRADGSVTTIQLLCRLDTAFDVDCFMHGGILPRVMRGALAEAT